MSENSSSETPLDQKLARDGSENLRVLENIERDITFFKILKVGHLCKKTYFCDQICKI